MPPRSSRCHATRTVSFWRREFGADDIVAERGKEGAAAVREIFDGIGADFVLECVGTSESMKQAMLSVRPGGRIGYVGVPHDVVLNVPAMFGRNVGIAGGVAPVRAYIDDILPEVLNGTLKPGKVFDLTLPLDQVATGLPGDGRAHGDQVDADGLNGSTLHHGVDIERPVDVREAQRLPRHVVVLPRRRQQLCVDRQQQHRLGHVAIEPVEHAVDLLRPRAVDEPDVGQVRPSVDTV